MKVCILTSVHSPFDARIFHKEAKSLLKVGYAVTIIAQHNKDELADGIRIAALPRARNRLQRMLGTWQAFRLALRQKADVYHFHDPELLPWGWLLHKLTGKPVIYDVHENYADTILFKPWLPHPLRKPLARMFIRIEKTFASRLAAIITVTESMKQRFSDGRVTCVSVHNFTSREIAIGFDTIKELGNRNKQYSIICTGGGRLSRENVFETVLEALDLVAKQDSTTTCVILGEIRNLKLLDRKHDRLAARLSKDGNLIMPGRVPHHEVFQYSKSSSIGWKPEPSVLQRISIVTRVLEYMACGKPVVLAADSSLTTDIVQETKCGILVPPYDARAHASAILYLLEHPEEARRMGENGRRAVLEKYNWENESKKLLALYAKLIKTWQ